MQSSEEVTILHDAFDVEELEQRLENDPWFTIETPHGDTIE